MHVGMLVMVAVLMAMRPVIVNMPVRMRPVFPGQPQTPGHVCQPEANQQPGRQVAAHALQPFDRRNTGADRDAVSYADLRTLAALDPVVESVVGHTRYSLEGDPSSGDCIVRKLESGGLSRDLVSRTDAQPVLRGNTEMPSSAAI